MKISIEDIQAVLTQKFCKGEYNNSSQLRPLSVSHCYSNNIIVKTIELIAYQYL